VIAVNKSDLGERVVLSPEQHDRAVRLSAMTGAGVADLEAAFSRFLMDHSSQGPEAVLTNARQRDSVIGAMEALERARQAIRQGIPPEMALIDLYDGLSHLNTLTGDTLTEDILDRVFSKFCVGK
jgi:tRNA modification GTPase